MSDQMNPTEPDPVEPDLTVMFDESLISMSIEGQDSDGMDLAILDDPEPQQAGRRGTAEKPPSTSKPARAERIGSPTLEKILKGRRPNPSTVCEVCPASMWFATPDEVKCYCKEMFLITWSTSEPGPMTSCDGMIRAMEKSAENQEG